MNPDFVDYELSQLRYKRWFGYRGHGKSMINALLTQLANDPPCDEKPVALTPDERRKKQYDELVEARLATRRAIFRR